MAASLEKGPGHYRNTPLPGRARIVDTTKTEYVVEGIDDLKELVEPNTLILAEVRPLPADPDDVTRVWVSTNHIVAAWWLD